MDTLKTRFINLLKRLHSNGVSHEFVRKDNVLKPDFGYRWKYLAQEYNKPWRFYHTLDHIKYCLDVYDQHAEQDDILETAIWYHDVRYGTDPLLSSENEKESIEFMRSDLNHIKADIVQMHEIESCILATMYHRKYVPLYQRGLVMQDIDLAILGGSSAEYAWYQSMIRKEYEFVPELLYRTKRKQVLEQFLSESVYKTEKFQDLFEEKARQNIQNEISML